MELIALIGVSVAALIALFFGKARQVKRASLQERRKRLEAQIEQNKVLAIPVDRLQKRLEELDAAIEAAGQSDGDVDGAVDRVNAWLRARGGQG